MHYISKIFCKVFVTFHNFLKQFSNIYPNFIRCNRACKQVNPFKSAHNPPGICHTIYFARSIPHFARFIRNFIENGRKCKLILVDFSPGMAYTGDILKERGAVYEFGKQLVPGAEKVRPFPGGGGRKAGGEPADHLQVGDRAFPFLKIRI